MADEMDDEQRMLASAIGSTVRQVRRDAGLTLAQVAERTGLSQPFLSQTETGRATPSVMTLHKIAQSLGTTAHELLAQSQQPTPTYTARSEGRSFDLADGVTIRFLAPGQQRMEPNEVIAQPHSDAGMHTSHGGEEFIHVIEGTVHVVVGDGEPYVLRAGDTLYYASATDHRWSNPHDEAARFIIVNSPPSF